jgi:hypothetical protein
LFAAAAAAQAAHAAPPNGVTTPRLSSFRVGPNVQDGPGWSENFDSYAAGAGVIGQGGWVGWCGTGPDGRVSQDFARSAPNSMQAVTGTDVVQDWTNITSGQWIFKCYTYIPSSATGAGTMTGSIILLNNYCATVNPDWSVVISLGVAANTVTTWLSTATVPLIKDQWVEYRCEIDLGTDTFSDFYNNQPLDVNRSWSGGVQAGGQVRIDALDCYSENLNGIYYDDISLQPEVSCYPDCNASGNLTVADFGCFQTKFVAGDPYADCNASGTLTVADFGCFQTRFVAGCP